jgi:hypothetical protein
MAICLEKRFSWRPGFVRWLNQAEFFDQLVLDLCQDKEFRYRIWAK